MKRCFLLLLLAATMLFGLCGCQKTMTLHPDDGTIPEETSRNEFPPAAETQAQSGTAGDDAAPESSSGAAETAGETQAQTARTPESGFSAADCNLYMLSFPPAVLIYENRLTETVERVISCDEAGAVFLGTMDLSGRSLSAAAEFLAETYARREDLPRERSNAVLTVISYIGQDLAPLQTELEKARVTVSEQFGDTLSLTVEWADNARTYIPSDGDVAYCGCPDCEEGRVTCPRCMGDWEHGVAVISPGVPAVSFQACPDCDRGTLVCPRCGGAGGWTLSVRR